MRRVIIAAFLWLLSATTAMAEPPLGRLLVVTSPYCPYCQAFKDEVGAAYPRTEVGRLLPLTEVSNFDPPEGFEALAREIRFVPTFLVLDREGREQARLRGYRGDEFFWSDLEPVVAQMRTRLAADSGRKRD